MDKGLRLFCQPGFFGWRLALQSVLTKVTLYPVSSAVRGFRSGVSQVMCILHDFRRFVRILLAGCVIAGPSSDSSDSNSALPADPDVGPRSPGLDLPVPGGVLSPMTPSGLSEVPEQNSAEIREEAFNAALTGLLPMEPDEIRRVLKRYDQTREAVEIPVYPYPEPEIAIIDVPIDPGTRPVEIKLATGHVTTVNFLDASGAPWPVQDLTWAGNFEVVAPEEGSNIIRITPMGEFAYGNVSIRMLEMKTPITFILKTRRDGVYYRVDARLPDYGPLATPPIIDGGITLAAGDTNMTSVLEGIPPQDIIKLVVEGADGRTSAFKQGSDIYVRTPLTLLSPAWAGSVRSADGMNVYMIRNAPVLLLSDQGRMVRVRLAEKAEKDSQ